MSITQAATLLGVHRQTMYRWAKTGKVKNSQRYPGGKILISIEEFMDLLD